MGSKEDRLPTRYLFGFAGQMRPLQVIGGKCVKCHEEVWIDHTPTDKQYRETLVVHHGCESKTEHRSGFVLERKI